MAYITDAARPWEFCGARFALPAGASAQAYELTRLQVRMSFYRAQRAVASYKRVPGVRQAHLLHSPHGSVASSAGSESCCSGPVPPPRHSASGRRPPEVGTVKGSLLSSLQAQPLPMQDRDSRFALALEKACFFENSGGRGAHRCPGSALCLWMLGGCIPAPRRVLGTASHRWRACKGTPHNT